MVDSITDHPNVQYIKEESIGPVIAQGLAKLVRESPEDPVHFLGNWLLNYHSTNKGRAGLNAEDKRKKELMDKQASALEALKQVEAMQAKEQEAKDAIEINFLEMLQTNNFLEDKLNEFANHLWNNLGCNGVYIGEYDKIKKPVTEADSDKAHIDRHGKLIVKYIAASDNCGHLLGKTLAEQDGPITYSVWKDLPSEEIDESAPPQAEEEEEESLEESSERLNYRFIPNVIKEPRIHYFDVPRLGCYLAIPLDYESCLNERGFVKGVERTLKYKQEKEARRLKEVERADKIAEGKEPDPITEEEENQEPLMKPEYSTVINSFVVCLDTLGQDRKFSPQELTWCEKWVRQYKENWERGERDNLRSDIKLYIARGELDKAHTEECAAVWQEEEKSTREESAKEAALQAMTTEQQLQFANLQIINLLKERLQTEYFVDAINELKKYHVLKHDKTMQLIFYYFGVKNYHINAPETNAIFWKKAKSMINSNFFMYIKNVDPIGPKKFEPPVYAMTRRLLTELEGLPLEEIDQFNLAMGLMLKFTILCLQTRVADVATRRYNFAAKRAERTKAIELAKEREKKFNDELEVAKISHQNDQEDLPEGQSPTDFDLEKFKNDFDEKNPEVEIPPEEFPDKDGDIEWEEPEV